MGLTYEELRELLQYIEKNHSWKNMYEIHSNNKDKTPKVIKYVTFNMDTRGCDIWHIKFYSIAGYKDNEIEFRTERGYDLKSEIYKWLQSA